MCGYWSQNTSTGEKYLVSVVHETISGLCKYVHKMDSGQKFCLDSLQHNNDYLNIRPCIEGLVDEVSVYYEVCSNGKTDDPLVLCIKKSNGTADATCCYYCKGTDNCWYRYKNGSNGSQIPPRNTNSEGLGKLLEKLKDSPHQLTKVKYDSLNNLQSDNDN